MREYKFRAWHPNREKMYYQYHILLDRDDMDQDILNTMTREGKHLEIMQWTGLQDTNDIDIYEGDIVKELQTGLIGVVKQERNGLWLWVSNYSVLAYIDRLEIIGNQFENPELLEQ